MTSAALYSFRLDIISDTICPWCYVGKRRLCGGAPNFGSRRAHVRCGLASFPAKPDHAEGRPRSARIPLS